jgi:hypothetical protein
MAARDDVMANETFQQIGEPLFPDIDDAHRKELSDRLSKMIDYAIKRQDWYEDQRNKTLALGVSLLALSSFLVGGLLSAGINNMMYFRVFAGCTLISIVFTAAAIVFEYVRGANEKYTHRDLADIRSWFFRYIVKDSMIDAAIANSIAQAPAKKATIIDAWKQFIAAWTQYAQDPKGFILEDLQQVFILYLFQAMRRRSLRKMIAAATSGSVIITVFLLGTIVCAMFRV